MADLTPNTVTRASTTPLTMTDVPQDQRASGHPRTGSAALGSFAGLEVGVWEMTAGTMHDTEVDELFIVLSGSARVDFLDGAPTLELSAGDVVRLTAGTRTLWTVRESLRKVYLA